MVMIHLSKVMKAPTSTQTARSLQVAEDGLKLLQSLAPTSTMNIGITICMKVCMDCMYVWHNGMRGVLIRTGGPPHR